MIIAIIKIIAKGTNKLDSLFISKYIDILWIKYILDNSEGLDRAVINGNIEAIVNNSEIVLKKTRIPEKNNWIFLSLDICFHNFDSNENVLYSNLSNNNSI